MAQKFYSGYVGHCLRCYSRHPAHTAENEADKHNREACDFALKSFSDSDREMLLAIYRDDGTVAENVLSAAQMYGVKPNRIWKLIGELEREVAINRGLL